MRLRHRVGEGIAEHGLWQPGDRVAVAVSGGLDSVVLLDVLLATARWHGGRIEVATVDHGLHAQSAEHAAFVAALAAERGVSCEVIRLGLAPGADEATARAARYAAFDRLDVERVALAHHADDSVETVLVNLLRGTGAVGLAGIPRRRGRYVRPLLEVSRADIQRYAEAHALRWCTDPTNADPRFLRNRLRAEVIPLLESIRPGARGAIARSARTVARDAALLDALVASDPRAAGPDAWPIDFVAEAPEPLVRRALSGAVRGLAASVADAVIRAARKGRGRVLAQGGAFVVEGDTVRWVGT